jgi:hypothetical protein
MIPVAMAASGLLAGLIAVAVAVIGFVVVLSSGSGPRGGGGDPGDQAGPDG